MTALTGAADFAVRMLPGTLPAALLYALLLPPRRRRLSRLGLESPPCRELALLLFLLFCGGLALLTLTPRWFHWLALLNGGQAEFPAFFQLGRANLIPLRTFSFDPWSMMILAGNVAMFLPIGFFAALLWRNATLRRALEIGLAATLFIECWQLFVGRSFDIDDLLLNTAGVLLGHLLCRLLIRLTPSLSPLFQVRTVQP